MAAPHLAALAALPGVTLKSTMADAAAFVAANPPRAITFTVEVNGRGARMFVCTTPEGWRAVVDAVARGNDYHLHECFGDRAARERACTRFFVDLDVLCETEEDMVHNRALTDAALVELQNYLILEGKPFISKCDADGFSPTKNAFKVSTHLVWGHWLRACELVWYAQYLRDELAAHNLHGLQDMDPAVYHGLGLRLVGNSKIGDPRVKKLVFGNLEDALLQPPELDPHLMLHVTPPEQASVSKRARSDERVDVNELHALVPCYEQTAAHTAYDEWVRVGMALADAAHTTQEFDAVRMVWLRFSQLSPRFNETAALSKWHSLLQTRTRVTVATFYRGARLGNPDLYHRVRAQYLPAHTHTHKGHAEVFQRLRGGEVVYTHQRWFLLGSDSRWAEDTSGSKSMVMLLLAETLLAFVDTQYPEKGKVHANVESKAWLSGVMSFLEGLCTDDTFFSRLDAEPYELAFTNGVLDLRTWQLRPIIPEDYISKSTGFPFAHRVPEEELTAVQRFFEDVFLQADIRQYNLASLAGFLVGDNPAQKLTFWLGSGANGKNKVATLLQHTLGGDHQAGGYCATWSKAVLLELPKVGAPNPELYVPGVRFVVVDEIDADDELDPTQFKLITGQGDIVCRRLYGQPIVYRPAFKIGVLSQYRGRFKRVDFACERRLDTLPFCTEFRLREETDPAKSFNPANPLHRLRSLDGFPEAVLKSWRLAFVHFLRPYLQHWMECHGAVPKPPLVSTMEREYLSTQDPVGVFVRERCVKDTLANARGPVHKFLVSAAYAEFLRANEMTAREMPPSTFKAAVASHGFPLGKAYHGRVAFMHMRLRDGDGDGFMDPNPPAASGAVHYE